MSLHAVLHSYLYHLCRASLVWHLSASLSDLQPIGFLCFLGALLFCPYLDLFAKFLVRLYIISCNTILYYTRYSLLQTIKDTFEKHVPYTYIYIYRTQTLLTYCNRSTYKSAIRSDIVQSSLLQDIYITSGFLLLLLLNQLPIFVEVQHFCFGRNISGALLRWPAGSAEMYSNFLKEEEEEFYKLRPGTDVIMTKQ